MKRGRAGVVVVVVLVAILVVPVLVAQLREPQQRQLAAVTLAETDYREVVFHNAAQDLQLAGLLFVPDGAGPFPAAVIIHGSGTSHRDNGWYLTLVQHLQDQGVVVLLPDKRGSGASEGDWRTASFDDLATDTLAAIAYLWRQPEVPVAGVGVIGMSQGGHIAPLVAQQAPDLAFVVNVVGAAVPMHRQLVYEETHNLRELGLLPGVSDVLAYPAAWSLIAVRQKTFWDAVGNFDPLPYWRDLSVPALVLYGEEDTNVPTKRSAELLRALDNPHIEVRVFEGSGHALASPEGAGNRIFREDALRGISDFIVSAGRPGG